MKQFLTLLKSLYESDKRQVLALIQSAEGGVVAFLDGLLNDVKAGRHRWHRAQRAQARDRGRPRSVRAVARPRSRLRRFFLSLGSQATRCDPWVTRRDARTDSKPQDAASVNPHIRV